MPSNPRFHRERMTALTHVWSTLYPNKDFSGLSCEEVKRGFQESFETRARLAELHAQLAATLHARKIADDAAIRLYHRAISAIRADANESDSQKMLRALDYVSKKSVCPPPASPLSPLNSQDPETQRAIPPLRVIEGAA